MTNTNLLAIVSEVAAAAKARKAPKAPKINAGLARVNAAYVQAQQAAELAELSAIHTTPAPVYSAPEIYGPAIPADLLLTAEYGPAIHAVAQPVKAAKPAKEVKVKAPRVSKGINLAAPGFKPIAARAGTKTAILIDELATGTTVERLVVLLAAAGGKPWLADSVKVGFGYDVKIKGYGVRTEFVTDPDLMSAHDPVLAKEMALEALANAGVVAPRAVYFLVYPECHEDASLGDVHPVPHTPRKAAKSEAAQAA